MRILSRMASGTDRSIGRRCNGWSVLVVAWLLALVAGAFSNALPRNFIYDNREIVSEHEGLQPGTPWWRLFGKTYWGDESSTSYAYRPVTMLSFWIEKRIVGFDQAWQHAIVNIVLHAGVTLLVWRLALCWAGAVPGARADPEAESRAGRRARVVAIVAASLFAVHPIASEIVPNLVGRGDLLATAGVLGALLLWERRRDSDGAARWAWLAAVAATWVLGLLAKESAVVLPPILFVRDVWVARQPLKQEFLAKLAKARSLGDRFNAWASFGWNNSLMQRHGRAYLVLGVVGLVWLGCRAWVIAHGPPAYLSPLDNPLVLAGPGDRLMTVVKVWGLDLRLALLPFWQSADYSFNTIPVVVSPTDPAFLAALAAVLGYVGLTVWLWRVRPAAAMGLTFMAVAIFPVSNLLIIIGTLMADRLMYLPLVGGCMAAGVGTQAALEALRRTRLRGAALPLVAATVLAAIIMLGVQTRQRNRVWLDGTPFWHYTARDAPRSWRVWDTLMTANAAMPDTPETLDRAVAYAERLMHVLEPMPAWAVIDARLDAGATHIDRAYDHMADQGMTQRVRLDLVRAADLLTAALRAFNSSNPYTRYQVQARAYLESRGIKQDYDERRMRLLSNLGKAFYGLHRYGQAAAVFAQAVRLNDRDVQMLLMYGRSLANAGRFDAAEQALRRAVEIAPDQPQPKEALDQLLEAKPRPSLPIPNP